MNVNVASTPPARLDMEELLAEARSATGLSDFGDPWFLRPLTQLIAFINDEAGLMAKDAPSVHFIKACLADRLRCTEFLKRHPAVLDEEVQVAGVVVGMPRGGSTLLQRLLCSSPQITAPFFWELMSPFPLPGEQPGDPTPRIQHTQTFLDGMQRDWPGSTDIHPMYAATYDEESPLIERSFLSVDFIFYFHLPSWVRWHIAQDQTKAYAELKVWLQILQYQDPARRNQKWLLKSGHHIWCGGLRYLLNTFPEAKALMTHRGLENVVPSVCSLQATYLNAHTRGFDQKVLGPEAMQLYGDALKHLIAVRDEQPADRFIDIQYTDLVKDPVAQFRRALTAMGFTVGPDDEQAARQWLADNRGEAQSRHTYTPEDFGLTRAAIQ